MVVHPLVEIMPKAKGIFVTSPLYNCNLLYFSFRPSYGSLPPVTLRAARHTQKCKPSQLDNPSRELGLGPLQQQAP